MALAVVAVVLIATVAACSRADSTGPTTTRVPGTALAGAEACARVPEEDQEAEGIEVVHAFEGSDGANPWGSLLEWNDGRLYGRTWGGGQEDAGVLFAAEADGSGYEVLQSFSAGPDATSGNGPRYDFPGMYSRFITNNVAGGGPDGHGLTFFVDPLTGERQEMHAYQGGPGDGGQPSSGIETTPEGMWILAATGGEHGQGALVRMDPQTGATEVAHAFSGPDGSEPRGRVTRSGPRVLYGMTSRGGQLDAGVVFSFDPVTRQFQVLHEFAGGPNDGARPHHGKLLGGSPDGRLWGLTEAGGPHDRGVLFSIAPDGSEPRVHHAFGGGSADAAAPQGSLVRAGSHLYGLSAAGGRFGLGALFRIGDDGQGYEVLASFGGSQAGAFPRDNVTAVEAGGAPPVLYGLTSTGGPNDPGCSQGLGTLFRYDLAAHPR